MASRVAFPSGQTGWYFQPVEGGRWFDGGVAMRRLRLFTVAGIAIVAVVVAGCTSQSSMQSASTEPTQISTATSTTLSQGSAIAQTAALDETSEAFGSSTDAGSKDLCQDTPTSQIRSLFGQHGLTGQLECGHPTAREWAWADESDGAVFDIRVYRGSDADQLWNLAGTEADGQVTTRSGVQTRNTNHYGFMIKLREGIVTPTMVALPPFDPTADQSFAEAAIPTLESIIDGP